jgi:glutamate/tyrosine decarboxylase-like PLP-dependent enzyme
VSADLISNTARGVLAEYLVARALGIDVSGVRDSWAAYDLRTPSGIKVEVKSAAYLQSWHQNKLSIVSFRTPKTRAWNPDTNRLDAEAKRQADVYVFAILAHRQKSTLNPCDVSQWEFYVLPTRVLNQRTRSQHSITLPTLTRLSGGPVAYGDLMRKVQEAAPGPGAATLQPPQPG